MICDALREQGYRVIETSDGQDAVRAAGEQRGPIDLLLTDMVMPRMGGEEVSRALTGMQRAAKVLYMSGHTDVNLGAASYFLKKPFTPESLLEKIRSVLDGSDN
jgi:DNA-binding response OmpR family regulator